ncbi:MAG: recombinase family protein, partial [Nitrososphaerota archaeon]
MEGGSEGMRAAIYARISTEEQNELSIDSQLAECRKYCEERGYQVVAEFTEERSAYRSKRPVFYQMIERAKLREFDVIVCWNSSRFSRRRAEAARVKFELQQVGVRIEFVSEPTPRGAESVIIDAMREGIAEYYSARISEDVRRSLYLKCERGIYPGGPPPFGYIVKDGHLYPHPEKAWMVKQAFEWYAKGINGRVIAKLLGVHKSRVYEWLRNPVYKGEFKWAGRTWRGIAEPIVSEELWNIVAKRLEAMSQGPLKRQPVKYWLTGNLVCGYCGQKLSGCTVKDKFGYYRCKNYCLPYIRKSEIENFVANKVAYLITRSEIRERVLRRAQQILHDWLKRFEHEIWIANEQIGKIKQRRQQLWRAVEEGAPWQSVAERLEELDKEERRIREIIEQVSPVWEACRTRTFATEIGEEVWQKLAEEIKSDPQTC